MQYRDFYPSQFLIIFTKAGKQSGGSTKISNSYVIPIWLCSVVYIFFLLNRSVFLIVLLRLILNSAFPESNQLGQKAIRSGGRLAC